MAKIMSVNYVTTKVVIYGLLALGAYCMGFQNFWDKDWDGAAGWIALGSVTVLELHRFLDEQNALLDKLRKGF